MCVWAQYLLLKLALMRCINEQCFHVLGGGDWICGERPLVWSGVQGRSICVGMHGRGFAECRQHCALLSGTWEKPCCCALTGVAR